MKRNIWGLTVKQPWAAAIVFGSKRIENRDWKASNARIGEFIAIHAGKTIDKHLRTEHFIWDEMGCTFGKDQIVTSAIIGVAVLAGYVTESDSPWFQGKYGWVLKDIHPIEPVPCRGQQGLWTLPPDVLAVVRARYQAAMLV